MTSILVATDDIGGRQVAVNGVLPDVPRDTYFEAADSTVEALSNAFVPFTRQAAIGQRTGRITITKHKRGRGGRVPVGINGTIYQRTIGEAYFPVDGEIEALTAASILFVYEAPTFAAEALVADNYLDSRVTFARGTVATLFDSAGKLTYAPNNLLLYSEQFDHATYTKTNCAVTPNAIANPLDGAVTADLITTSATGDAVEQTFNVVAGRSYIFSQYFRDLTAGTLAIVALTQFASSPYAQFNLATGVASLGGGTLSNFTLTPVGNGWYRASITAVATSTGAAVIRTASLSVDAVSAYYAYGVMVETVTYETSPRTYRATTTAAYHGPRFNYDPVNRTLLGLLIEEARTNLLVQSADFTTSWSLNNGGTITGNTTIAPDGTMSADTLVDDQAAAYSTVSQVLTVANNNAKYACSVHVLKTTGATTFPGFTAALSGGSGYASSATLNTNTGVAVARTANVPDFLTVTDAGLFWRISFGITNNTSGNTTLTITFLAAVNADASGTWVNTATGSMTLWGAALEVGAFSLSYIHTAAAAITRNADDASITGTNFSNLYNTAEGTFLAQVDLPPATNAEIISLYDSSAGTANSLDLYKKTGNTLSFQVYSASSIVAGMDMTPLAAGQHKVAMAYKLDDCAVCADGGAIVADTSAAVPVNLANFSIGRYKDTGLAYHNAHIKSLLYYRTRLANNQLQIATAA